jgi:ABC-type nitrate/sulfonate/bicarbonate transport system substrate-binding protein
LRLGYLAFTAAAPLIAARENGIYARYGLQVELHREIGWATLRERILYGELDGGQVPAPMLWSAQLGLGCRAQDVLTALVLSLRAGALTLSAALWEAGVRDGPSLREHLRGGHRRDAINLGVPFPFSSEHLSLRDWLRGAGLDDGRSVRVVIVPPAQMSRHLVAGTIDGFYVGEPWNSQAVRAENGWCPAWSGAAQPEQPGKVLMVTRSFAESRPAEHSALVGALSEACAWCDEPGNRERIVSLLARPEYLNLPAAVIGPGLLGRFSCGHGRVETAPYFHTFHRGNTNLPSAARATSVQQALVAAGLLPPAVAADSGLPRRLFREDLHLEFLRSGPALESSAPQPVGIAR